MKPKHTVVMDFIAGRARAGVIRLTKVTGSRRRASADTEAVQAPRPGAG
jgi:hypothetical protein